MIRYPPDGVHIGTGMLYLDKYRNSITATPIVLRMETVVNGLQQLSSCLLFTLPNLFMIHLLTQVTFIALLPKMSCIYLSYTIAYVICPVSVRISSIFVKMFVEFQKTPIDTVYKYLFQFSANILLGNLKWKNSFFVKM